MKLLKYTSLIAILVLFACKNDGKEKETEVVETEIEKVVEDVTENQEVASVTMQLSAKSGSEVKGTVTFTQKDGNVTMEASLTGLSEGEHAIHIHEKADCSNDGKATGGHWNPTFKPHAKWGASEGYHKGDIGNFTANPDGTATITFDAGDQWCLGCDDETKNIIGKAIIVHQGVDDFTSQPSGAAGARVSCGGIIQ
ncbi:MAG: superoxide dismutase family protein [Gilvibacter sp.]